MTSEECLFQSKFPYFTLKQFILGFIFEIIEKVCFVTGLTTSTRTTASQAETTTSQAGKKDKNSFR